MKIKNEGRSLTPDRDVILASFDKANKEALSETRADINFTAVTLTLSVLKSGPADSDVWLHVMSLFNRAHETLVSSLYLARQRAIHDSYALLRVAVETAAVAVHIRKNEKAYEEYTKGSGRRYKSTRAISFARPLIPKMAEVWGALSETVIHTNVHTYGPNQNGDGTLSVRLFHEEDDLMRDRQNLRAVSVAAALVFRSVELVLFDERLDKPGLLQLWQGPMYKTPLAERLLERRLEEFTVGTKKLKEQGSPKEGNPT